MTQEASLPAPRPAKPHLRRLGGFNKKIDALVFDNPQILRRQLFDDGTICYTFASAGVHLTIVDEGVNGFTYYTFEGPAKERSYREGKIKSALGMWKLVKWAEAARGLG